MERPSSHQKIGESSKLKQVNTKAKGFTSVGSFIKFLNNDDMASKLQIPSQFMLEHGGTLLRSCLLKEIGSPSSGWPVSVDSIEEYSYFVDGWSIFAEDIDLKPGMYLHFTYLGNSRFEVSVYETTGSIRECRPGLNAGFQAVKPERVKIEHGTQKMRSYYTFSMDITPYYLTRCLHIPKSFMIETGITNNRAVDIHDEKGRIWPAMIRYSKSGYLILCEGWLPFVRENKLEAHNKIWFKFTPGRRNIFEIKVTRRQLILDVSG